MEQPPAEPEPAVYDDLLIVGAGRRDALLPRRDPQGPQIGAISMQSLFRADIQVSIPFSKIYYSFVISSYSRQYVGTYSIRYMYFS